MMLRYRCCGYDPKLKKNLVYGWSNDHNEARSIAREAALEYINRYDSRASPISEWKFTIEDMLPKIEMVRASIFMRPRFPRQVI